MSFSLNMCLLMDQSLVVFSQIFFVSKMYYIVILRWPVGSRRLHQNNTVIRRVTMVRTERECDLRFVRAMSPKLGQ